jgi:hypothetical protein
VNSKVLRFDELTHATRTFTIPEHADLAGLVEKRKQTLWLLDSEGATGADEPSLGRDGSADRGEHRSGSGQWRALDRDAGPPPVQRRP